jgi:Tetratricopeptide repeat
MPRLGTAASEEGDLASARRLLEESIERFRELGDEHYTLVSMDNLAWTCTQLGELDRARALHEAELPVARAMGNVRIEAMALGGLAGLALDEGQIASALSMLKKSLPIWRGLDNLQMVARDFRRFARGLALGERPGRATQILSCSEVLREQVGASEGGFAEFNEGTIAVIRAQLDDGAFREAWEQGRKLTVDEAVELALGSLD